MSTADRRFVRLLAVYALVLLALHLIVDQLPAEWAYLLYPQSLVGPGGRLQAEEWLWGVTPVTVAPVWLRWGAAVLLGAAILVGGWAADLGRLRSLHLPFPRRSGVQTLLAALSFFLFFAGRVVHTRWGDAYLLVKGIADPVVRLAYNWQAPLDTYVHARLFQVGERLWGWTDAMPAYWWLSSLAGAAAVWVLLRLAADLGRSNLQAWTVLGLMATLGSIQLFFGYPENYTLISLISLLYLWLAWRCLQGRSSLWAPSIVLALAHGFHPATLALQPSLWVLAWVKIHQPGRRTGLAPTLAALILPSAAVAAGVLALMTAGGHGLEAFLGMEAPGGGDRRWLVPLANPSGVWEYYTLFSRGHLMDMLNQQWLVMPFTLPLLALLALFYRAQLPRDGYSGFLLAAAAAYVLLTWLWNPDYGGQRDWDLFAVAAWPATLLAAYWLIRVLAAEVLGRTLLIILPLQAAHTAVWVFSNTRPWEWPA